MAVAIRDGRRMLGSLSIRFPRSAMSEEDAAQRYGRRMASLARAIAVDVSEPYAAEASAAGPVAVLMDPRPCHAVLERGTNIHSAHNVLQEFSGRDQRNLGT